VLGTKSGVGKLLKDKFPNITLWHCLNHRIELAVGDTLGIANGKNGLQSLIASLHSLHSLSPKNMLELSECAHDFHVTLKRNGKLFAVLWVAASYRRYQKSGILFQPQRNILTTIQTMKIDKVLTKQHFKD